MRKRVLAGVCAALMSVGVACERGSAIRPDGLDSSEKSELQNSDSDSAPSQTPQKVVILGQPKKRVAVLDFWNDSPTHQSSLGPYAADELRKALSKTQKVILQEEMRSTPSTEDFLAGDQIKVGQLIREGRRLGMNVLVVGKVNKVSFKESGDAVGLFRKKQSLVSVEMEAKLFDVQEGRELVALNRTGEASISNVAFFDSKNTIENPDFRSALAQKAVREVVLGFIPEMMKTVEKMTWQGRIAKLIGQKVYINAGKSSGLTSGDILRVLSTGEDLYDPVSGAYLGHTPGQLKGTLEVKDFLGQDAAVTEIHTGGNFKEGDFVQLY